MHSEVMFQSWIFKSKVGWDRDGSGHLTKSLCNKRPLSLAFKNGNLVHRLATHSDWRRPRVAKLFLTLARTGLGEIRIEQWGPSLLFPNWQN